MARANRHYIPGCIWHITHRCHKQEFLLKFRKDKSRWLHWLFESKKRYGLSILNYAVTSNHIHLLTVDTAPQVISRSIQLTAGRTAREYNLRKKRKGAFWEDRYHATAVQDGEYLMACLAYIDMNMVRTGAVRHPSEWEFCGFSRIMSPPRRYRLLDYNRLVSLCGYGDLSLFQAGYRSLIEDALKTEIHRRKGYFTESIAVGNQHFIEKIYQRFGILAGGRDIKAEDGLYMVRENDEAYSSVFDARKMHLRVKNTFLWDVYA